MSKEVGKEAAGSVSTHRKCAVGLASGDTVNSKYHAPEVTAVVVRTMRYPLLHVAVRRSREKLTMAALSASEKVTPVGSLAPSTGLRAPFFCLAVGAAAAGAPAAAAPSCAGGGAADAVEVRWRLDIESFAQIAVSGALLIL